MDNNSTGLNREAGYERRDARAAVGRISLVTSVLSAVRPHMGRALRLYGREFEPINWFDRTNGRAHHATGLGPNRST